MRIRQLKSVLAKAVCLVVLAGTWAPQRAVAQQPPNRREFPIGTLRQTTDLPAGRVRNRLEQLPAAQRDRAMNWLRSFHFTELDLQNLEIDSEGGVFYVDPPAPLAAAATETEPVTAAASIA